MSRAGRRVARRTGQTPTGAQGKHVNVMIERLEAEADTDDLRQVIADLVTAVTGEQDRLAEENAQLRRRVARLERVIVALGAAAEIIGPTPAE